MDKIGGKMKLKDLIIDRLDITVSQFCKEVGISRQTIDNILNDYKRAKAKSPSLLTIKRICKYFDVDFRDYLN